MDVSDEAPEVKPKKGKYRPSIGSSEFDGVVPSEEVQKIKARDSYETSRTRDKIAFVVLGSSAAALLIAALYGFYTGDFTALVAVWSGVGPIVGGIITWYFQIRKESG
jgi:hypothetical protein